jgi:hypothetical protein
VSVYEPLTKEQQPAWLVAAVDQRLAFMKDKMGPGGLAFALKTGLVMTMLTEPDEHASAAQRKRWEHSCDNCGKHCPHDIESAHVMLDVDGGKVVITFGACRECATWVR